MENEIMEKTQAQENLDKVVYLKAKLVNVFGNENTPDRSFVVVVQLADGQGVHTNLGNVLTQEGLTESLTLDAKKVQEEITNPEFDPMILAIPTIGSKVARALWDNDIRILDDLKNVSNDFLNGITGVTALNVAKIRQVVPLEE